MSYSQPVFLSSITDICESCVVQMTPYTLGIQAYRLSVLFALFPIHIVRSIGGNNYSFCYKNYQAIVASKLWKMVIEGKCSLQQSVYPEFFELITMDSKVVQAYFKLCPPTKKTLRFLLNCCLILQFISVSKATLKMPLYKKLENRLH